MNMFTDSIHVTNGMDSVIQQVAKKSAKARDIVILEQLSELINRGLLIVEERESPRLSVSQRADRPLGEVQLDIRNDIRVVLKDQEYIEKLEADNEKYKKRLAKLDEAMNE